MQILILLICFCFYCIGFSWAVISFPVCDDLIDLDDGNLESFCALCKTSRLQQQCGNECQEKGCGGVPKKGKKTIKKIAVTEQTPEETSREQPKVQQPRIITEKPIEKTDDKTQEERNINKKNKPECDGVTPCIEVHKASKKFQSCCIEKGLKDSCIDKCRYNIRRSELQDAVIRGMCPIDTMRIYLECAANSDNNIGCCSKVGVLDHGRKVCKPLCNPSGPAWPADKEQAKRLLPCLSQFDPIMKCHWASIKDE